MCVCVCVCVYVCVCMCVPLIVWLVCMDGHIYLNGAQTSLRGVCVYNKNCWQFTCRAIVL